MQPPRIPARGGGNIFLIIESRSFEKPIKATDCGKNSFASYDVVEQIQRRVLSEFQRVRKATSMLKYCIRTNGN